MISEQQYVTGSLDLHLFFGRIMKEHAIFLQAGFGQPAAAFARIADHYKAQFENILHFAAQLADGVAAPAAIASGEFVTDFTLGAEKKTQDFTGILINTGITEAEARLTGGENPRITPMLLQQVRQLNASVLPWLEGLLGFKERVREDVLACRMFTANYPAVFTHMIHETQMYMRDLTALEKGESPDRDAKDTMQFWNEDMVEHLAVIAGMLDPSETNLMKAAGDLAAAFQSLEGVSETLALVERIRGFKAGLTEGIAACKIRSIILPLFADHMLREANHYLRLLQQLQI